MSRHVRRKGAPRAADGAALALQSITYRGHTYERGPGGSWFNLSPSPVGAITWAHFTQPEREALAAGEATPEDEQIAIVKRGIDRAEDGLLP